MVSGAYTGIVASGIVRAPAQTARHLRVRRIASASDNYVDFYELYIRDAQGNRLIPSTGSILPSALSGTMNNLFDNTTTTRWHSNIAAGGFVNDATTPMGYNFTFSVNVTIASIVVYVWDSSPRLNGLRFTLLDGTNTEVWRFDSTNNGTASTNAGEANLTVL